jgi:hypothetical protein
MRNALSAVRYTPPRVSQIHFGRTRRCRRAQECDANRRWTSTEPRAGKGSSKGTSRIRQVSGTRTSRFGLRGRKPRRSRPSTPVNGWYFGTSRKTYEFLGLGRSQSGNLSSARTAPCGRGIFSYCSAALASLICGRVLHLPGQCRIEPLNHESSPRWRLRSRHGHALANGDRLLKQWEPAEKTDIQNRANPQYP